MQGDAGMSDTRPDADTVDETTAPDVDAMLKQAEVMLKKQDAALHRLPQPVTQSSKLHNDLPRATGAGTHPPHCGRRYGTSRSAKTVTRKLSVPQIGSSALLLSGNRTLEHWCDASCPSRVARHNRVDACSNCRTPDRGDRRPDHSSKWSQFTCRRQNRHVPAARVFSMQRPF